MNRQLSVVERAENIQRILLRLHEPRAVFIVDGAFRTCALSDHRYEKAMVSHHCEFVGVYDYRAKREWLTEDMEWSMNRYRLWHPSR